MILFRLKRVERSSDRLREFKFFFISSPLSYQKQCPPIVVLAAMAVVRPLLRLSLRLHLRKFEKDSSHKLIEVVVKETTKAELAKGIIVVVAVIVILTPRCTLEL